MVQVQRRIVAATTFCRRGRRFLTTPTGLTVRTQKDFVLIVCVDHIEFAYESIHVFDPYTIPSISRHLDRSYKKHTPTFQFINERHIQKNYFEKTAIKKNHFYIKYLLILVY